MRARTLSNAAALLLASAVLVADSVGPTCETYLGWDVSYTYQTDCGGGDEGAFHGSAPDLTYEAAGGAPGPEDVTFAQTEGLFTIDILSISYDTGACGDTEGEGAFIGLILEISGASGETGMADGETWQCSGWDVDTTDQALSCAPSSGGASCGLLLTTAGR